VKFVDGVIFLEIFGLLIKFFFSFSAEFAQTRGEEMANANVSGKRSASTSRGNNADNRRATKYYEGEHRCFLSTGE